MAVHRELGTEGVETVGEASGKGTAYQPHRGSRTQHHSEVFGRKTARAEERWQERRDEFKRTESSA